ncbi:structural maintenance of chromosomes protein 1A-like [Ctenocephalides felis]|uniref:structural maintenance of chromosomes protein 1A-like n=1 Tax=Ctenocephalides felis TaxID=7515 RepID=UPI000E6E370C|nr:structural maintenance of chromosomes protein 1A-like [Ctenocephalides felis]
MPYTSPIQRHGSRCSGLLCLLIQIDFSNLPDNLKSEAISSEVHIKNETEKIIELEAEASASFSCKEGITRRLKEANDKLKICKETFKDIKDEMTSVNINLINVKKRRKEMFDECFNKVQGSIDSVYKSLTKCSGAQATLSIENIEEPYLGGVIFSCVPPGKRFRTMNHLSGGEKTVASLAFLFAMRSYKPSPFLLLDEVDSALDKFNSVLVADYINRCKNDVQIILISLNPEFYKSADTYIGTFLQRSRGMCTRIVSIPTAGYAD